MGTIENLIVDAWNRVRPHLQANPDELAARLARRDRPTMRRPLRAWCLAIRSADTRITPFDAPIVPEHAPALLQPHHVTVDSRLLRTLCRPVYLTPPGEPATDVARKLGVSYRDLHYPRFKGIFQTHYVPGIAGRGKPVPLLYTPRPLFPAAHLFAAPDPLWLADPDDLVQAIPLGIEQTIQRIPLMQDLNRRPRIPNPARRPSEALPPPPPDYVWYKWKNDVYVGDADDRRRAINRQKNADYRRRHPKPSQASGSLQFRGWMWICPACKKPVKTIYYPLPPIAIPSLQIENQKSKIENPFPPTFACWHCHHIDTPARTKPTTRWNDLVSRLSGGLLFGHEVPRPPDLQPTRTRPYRPQTSRPSPRRAQVLRRILNGWTHERIARDMSITKSCVSIHLAKLCRQEGVSNRYELARKLGSPQPQPLTIPQRTAARRQAIVRLLAAGRSRQQIMAELHLDRVTLNSDTWHIRHKPECLNVAIPQPA